MREDIQEGVRPRSFAIRGSGEFWKAPRGWGSPKACGINSIGTWPIARSYEPMGPNSPLRSNVWIVVGIIPRKCIASAGGMPAKALWRRRATT